MTAPVRVHIRVPGTAPMPDLMRLIRSIEAAGFDGAGILDSQLISRDTFVTLGQAATHTTNITHVTQIRVAPDVAKKGV